MQASLETFFGLGLIAGPMVGGILYSLGGYYLPFVSLGVLLFVVAFLTMCILPKNSENCPPNQTAGTLVLKKNVFRAFWRDKLIPIHLPIAVKISSIIKIPGVMVNSLSIIATSISIGFLGATLEPHLRQFNLSPISLGMSAMKLE